jgi:hypothetical protein
VKVPGGGDYGDWTSDELGTVCGDIGAMLYPDDVAMFSDAERDAWRAELHARERKRIRPGFYVGAEPLHPPDDDEPNEPNLGR